MKLVCFFTALLTLPLSAQTVYGIGDPGVVAPTAKKKVEPSYTDEARESHITGDVVLSIVIDTSGIAQNIRVISSLGWGLDEKAIATIQKWRFKPGTKDGNPVPVRALISVGFHIQGIEDSPEEEKRTTTNIALQNLKDPSPERRTKAVESLRKLADKRYGPAAFVYSLVLREGKEVAPNPQEADRYLENAASLHYGLAEYELGQKYMGEGKNSQGRELIIAGADHGSDAAQQFLGRAYMRGQSTFEQNDATARKYFALCASHGKVECRSQLGLLILNTPDRKNEDFEEAIAWLELAAQQGSKDADQSLQPVKSTITERQRKHIDALKKQLQQP